MSAVLELTEKSISNGNAGFAVKPHRFSVRTYDLMIERGVLDANDNVELLNGEIIDKTSKGKKYAYYNDLISDYLKETFGKESIVRNQNPIYLDEFSQPEPDIVLAKMPRENYLARHPAPEDILLLVEVSDSTLYFDRNEKGLAYAQAGIRQYLLINVENRTVEDYRNPNNDGYATKQTYKAGDVFSLLAFPNIEIAVEDFLQS